VWALGLGERGAYVRVRERCEFQLLGKAIQQPAKEDLPVGTIRPRSPRIKGPSGNDAGQLDDQRRAQSPQTRIKLPVVFWGGKPEKPQNALMHTCNRNFARKHAPYKHESNRLCTFNEELPHEVEPFAGRRRDLVYTPGVPLQHAALPIGQFAASTKVMALAS